MTKITVNVGEVLNSENYIITSELKEQLNALSHRVATLYNKRVDDFEIQFRMRNKRTVSAHEQELLDIVDREKNNVK